MEEDIKGVKDDLICVKVSVTDVKAKLDEEIKQLRDEGASIKAKLEQ